MIITVADLELTETERKHMNGPWRVWEAALRRLNNYGHAPFRPGELTKIVCGVDTPSNRNRVRNWMKGLAAMGRIAPLAKGGSTQLCILINNHVANRGAGKPMDFMCWEPSHADCRKRHWPEDAPVVEHVPQAFEDARLELEDDPMARVPAPRSAVHDTRQADSASLEDDPWYGLDDQ
jgi:hypothetical protein